MKTKENKIDPDVRLARRAWLNADAMEMLVAELGTGVVTSTAATDDVVTSAELDRRLVLAELAARQWIVRQLGHRDIEISELDGSFVAWRIHKKWGAKDLGPAAKRVRSGSVKVLVTIMGRLRHPRLLRVPSIESIHKHV